ncbi:hypothetical protein EI94DRAFT_52456 [Lactarius quietus]|nr:hypothetical protein EI94DRAFT_52456 [Lactarius quietus]
MFECKWDMPTWAITRRRRSPRFSRMMVHWLGSKGQHLRRHIHLSGRQTIHVPARPLPWTISVTANLSRSSSSESTPSPPNAKVAVACSDITTRKGNIGTCVGRRRPGSFGAAMFMHTSLHDWSSSYQACSSKFRDPRAVLQCQRDDYSARPTPNQVQQPPPLKCLFFSNPFLGASEQNAPCSTSLLLQTSESPSHVYTCGAGFRTTLGAMLI